MVRQSSLKTFLWVRFPLESQINFLSSGSIPSGITNFDFLKKVIIIINIKQKQMTH